MDTPKQKSKSEYNLIPLFVRGDRKFVNLLKSKAASADMPLADYVREKLDYAIELEQDNFFVSSGKDSSQSGKAS